MNDLTDRERQVLEMRGAGDSRRKIAQKFGISQTRVQQIERHAKRKLQFARKRAEVEQRLQVVQLKSNEEAVIRLYWDLDPPEDTRDNYYVREYAMKKLGVTYD